VVRFLVQTRDASVIQSVHTNARTLPASYSVGNRDSFLGCKGTFGTKPTAQLFCAELNKEWSYTSAHSYAVHVIYRTGITSPLYLEHFRFQKINWHLSFRPVYGNVYMWALFYNLIYVKIKQIYCYRGKAKIS
jgi:hypothetical protein